MIINVSVDQLIIVENGIEHSVTKANQIRFPQLEGDEPVMKNRIENNPVITLSPGGRNRLVPRRGSGRDRLVPR
jgi:hypothetical protein